MTRRVLVTGGAGFIGSHLCEQLHKRGDHVICLDNLSSGSKANLALLLDKPGFELWVGDVVDLPAVAVDRIFNLASPASPADYLRDPIGTVRSNVMGMLAVLELAERTGARVLQASTSEIYGDPDVHPQHEGYWGRVNCTGPRACYDEGKRAAETLCFDFARKRRVEVRVARIFNTYGPRMRVDDGRVVSNFLTQALGDKALTVHGDGSQTRAFCYVDDMVEGLLRFMEQEPAIGPLNLGSLDEIMVRTLAARIIALTGSRSSVVHEPLPVDDPKVRRPDITLARILIDWRPHTSLDAGLRTTARYFREVLEAGRTAMA